MPTAAVTIGFEILKQVQMQLHVWKRSHCYFVVWTECDYFEVAVPKDPSFKGVLDMLEDFVFTFFYPYLLSEARTERLERFRAAQEERRLKKLKKVQGDGQKGIQFFVPQISNAKKSPAKRKVLSK
jgi:hypothetical protein